MPKYRVGLYTEELYAEAIVEAPTREAAHARACEMSEDDVGKLHWRVSDDALNAYSIVRNMSVCEVSEIDLYAGNRQPHLRAGGGA